MITDNCSVVIGEVNAYRNLALVYQKLGEWERETSSSEQSLDLIKTVEKEIEL